MRKTQLRNYLRQLVLTVPLTAGACGGSSDGPADQSVYRCNPDFPKPADRTYAWTGADGGTDCMAFCIDRLNADHVGFRSSEVTCDVQSPIDLDAGTSEVRCAYLAPSGCGRAPAGLARPQLDESTAAGAYWARAAHLEAASVEAFERLASELAAHDAPAELVVRARSAAADERRHVNLVGALATRAGARVPDVNVTPFFVRPFLDIAIENTREGEVAETYGAVVALYQSQHAPDDAVRETMTLVADDELSHAELSWDIGRWLATRLSPSERIQLGVIRQQAAAVLRAQLVVDERPQLGLPDAVEALVLLDALSKNLWSCVATG